MRRKGRVSALQLLYQMDIAGELDAKVRLTPVALGTALGRFWESFESVGPEDRAFADRLVRGVVREIGYLDEALAEASHHWKVHRMDKVDRNLLRLAAYEILCCDDIPPAASINEAIEIAKRFSGNDSAGFINGILDQLARRGPVDIAPTPTQQPTALR